MFSGVPSSLLMCNCDGFAGGGTIAPQAEYMEAYLGDHNYQQNKKSGLVSSLSLTVPFGNFYGECPFHPKGSPAGVQQKENLVSPGGESMCCICFHQFEALSAPT